MVTLGVEALRSDSAFASDSFGLLTNASGVDGELRTSIDLLYDHPHADLHVLFSPQHGIRGNVQAGIHVKETTDDRTGLPVRNLSDGHPSLNPSVFDGLDTIVYDMQDIGCRYYTLVYTLTAALEAAAATDTTFVVCDRPNPISPLPRAGNRIDLAHTSKVGVYRLPIIHGMTVGELATYVNEEFDIGTNLVVYELMGWSHDRWYDETNLPWVQPSPNMPTLQTATLYPGTCLFEGTTLSEGRGTTKPFELVGAPWIDADEWATILTEQDLGGVGFRPAYFTPMFSKHERESIQGVQIHITDREVVDPVLVGVTMLVSAFQTYDESDWLATDDHFVDRLSGGGFLRKTVDGVSSANDPRTVAEGITNRWAEDLATFEAIYDRYRRYE